jgi:hypothetical protein
VHHPLKPSPPLHAAPLPTCMPRDTWMMASSLIPLPPMSSIASCPSVFLHTEYLCPPTEFVHGVPGA